MGLTQAMPLNKYLVQHADAIARRFLDPKGRYQELQPMLLYESEINKTQLIL